MRLRLGPLRTKIGFIGISTLDYRLRSRPAPGHDPFHAKNKGPQYPKGCGPLLSAFISRCKSASGFFFVFCTASRSAGLAASLARIIDELLQLFVAGPAWVRFIAHDEGWRPVDVHLPGCLRKFRDKRFRLG